MNTNYAKIFESMYTGSMYGAGIHVFAVWGWILAHKDENGLVEVNPELVAHELGGVAQQVEEAIAYLCARDPNSRSPEHEGRRLIKVSQFGHQVVNHEKYRTQGGSRAEYWRQWREKKQDGATVAQRCAQQTCRQQTETNTKTNTKKNKTFCRTSTEFRLAELLFTLMRANDSKTKEPNLQAWAASIDRLIRLDGRSAADIGAVIRWSQQDSFWKANILSTKKLRDKFSQLSLKMKGENDGQRGNRHQNRDFAKQHSAVGTTIES